MNEQRFVVSDVLWQWLKSHLPGMVSIEAPIFVKRRFELFLGRKAGCRFRERCSVLGNE
jgi:hypothetical protein